MKFIHGGVWPSVSMVNPTAAPDYPGFCETRFNADGTAYLAMRVCNLTSSALTKNQPYALRYSGAVSGNICVVAANTAVTGVFQNLGFAPYVPSTPTNIACTGGFSLTQIVVADEAIAASGYGFVSVAGYHDVLVDGSGTAIAVGDTLRLAPATSSVALIQDVGVTGLGPFARPPRSVAIAQAAASAAATTVRAFFFGEESAVAP